MDFDIVQILSGLAKQKPEALIADLVNNLEFQSVTECANTILNWCVQTVERVDPPIFGFAEYLATLAILTVIYTFGDAVYKFRARIAVIPLDIFGFVILTIVGVATLSLDYLISSFGMWPTNLPMPSFWQMFLGSIFFSLISSWIYFSFIRPPRFSRLNYKKYHEEIYNLIVKGSDAELEMLAYEIGRSAENLVLYAQEERGKRSKQDISIYANEILLMIANAKFCRKIIQSCPNTAIIFLSEVSRQKKYRIPIDTFAMNISKEAIMNKDSLLYHEDDGFDCGLLGYVKPFSVALYGDYKFLASLGHQTPLDVNYKVVRQWDADHLEAYCRATLVAFQSYLEHGSWWNIPSPLYRAFDVIENACNSLYEINEIPNPDRNDDRLRRLDVVMEFIRDAVAAVNSSKNIPDKISKRLGEHRSPQDPLDLIALMMFEIVFHASSISRSDFLGWHIQHNRVWSDFSWFETTYPKVHKYLMAKFMRLIYDEIKDIEKLPNYKSSKIIGFCLNVMGFNMARRTGLDVQFFPLQRLLLKQVQKHFIKVRKEMPEVAKAMLVGTLSYDAKNKRLVKTYIKGLNKKAPQDYFSLITGKFSNNSKSGG